MWYKRLINLLTLLAGTLSIVLCLLIYIYDSEEGQIALSMNWFETLLYYTPLVVKLVTMGILFFIGMSIFSSYTYKIKTD